MGGDFKMMVFLKEANHVELQPACVMSQHRVTCDDLIVWFAEKRREGYCNRQLWFASNRLGLWAKLTSFYVCGSVGGQCRPKEVCKKNEL